VWDGPHPLNLTQETFERIVAYVHRLLDEVRPQRTAFSLEMMPWMFPTTAQENLNLIDAVGRPGFVAHVDLVNITCSPRQYFESGRMIADAFATLGPRIKSVHAKDIVLREQLTTHLDEVRPGLGGFDYRALLTAVQATDPGIPVMLEHLSSQQDYDLAAEYVRGVAAELGLRCGTKAW
jgi:sugar phosphate isomerase/epimerase